MARRIDFSQLRNKLRQIEAKQRQAIARHNQQVRKYNQAVRNLQAALNRYNGEVRAYNSRRRLHQQRLNSELARLRSRSASSHVNFRTSVTRLHESYKRLEHAAAARPLSAPENFFLDLAERETANSVGVLNAVEAPEPTTAPASDLQQTTITDEIAVISEDLDSRWRGALFALHPGNPEAARHFCTSAREIFVEIFELKAPDGVVFQAIPACPRTERGNATRRSKMAYLLTQKGVSLDALTDFANEDVGNVMELFDLFNSGTHGASGRFDLSTLGAIKRRVEDGLLFLSRLAA